MKAKLSPAGGFTITGTSLSGKVRKSGDGYVAQNIVLDLRDLKSGMELRDKHIQEYFETSKYPKAVLLKAVGRGSKFEGVLKIRGITKHIEGTYEATPTSGRALFKVKMSDFKMKKASYMGLGVNDEISVTVEAPLGSS